MKFETISDSDLAVIGEFQPEGWSDILPNIQFYIQSSFCHPVKIVIDGQIAGIGAAIVFHHTGWMAHIIVKPEYRNRGFGSMMVKELLRILERENVETCSLIATELGKPVYLKAGFRQIAEYTFLERESPWTIVSASSNVVPFEEKYSAAIFELDKFISGEERSALLAPQVVNSFLYVKNGDLLGFYLPEMKEGLIYAKTDEAGIELMSLKYAWVDKAVLPSENRAGITFLKQKGFAEVRKASRMTIGKEFVWKPQMMFGRIGGNLG